MNARASIAAAASIVGMSALAVSVLAFAIFGSLDGPLGGGGCGGDGGLGGGSQQIGPGSWSAEQTGNARTITAIAISRRLPRRAAVLAMATAIVESALRNVGYGDRDSLGLFQQRPSQAWGTTEDILNPTYAAGAFYDHLVALPGWQVMPPGLAEQAVQRSATPGAYAPQEPAAAALVARFWAGLDSPASSTSAPLPGSPQSMQAVALIGCPDQGGSNLSIGPATLDAHQLPPGFELPADPVQHAAISYALAQVGKPYVWGAEGPEAFDCSGLMQAAYAAAGVPLSRTTSTLVHDGSPVPSLSQVSPGDLLLIPGADGTPTHPGHVGMYAGNGVIVDAYDTRRGVILETLAAWRSKIVAIRHIAGPTNRALLINNTAGSAA